MPGLDEKKPTYAPAYVVGIYPALAAKARELGYALALHGSVQRDLDLIAIPWTDEAVEPIVLINGLCEEFDLETNHPLREPGIKPHGRLAWTIPLWWGAYLDVSVMPRNVNKGDE